MSNKTPLEVVEAWHEAVNQQNLARLLELSNPNIEIVGPRGSGYGQQLLSDWLARAQITLQPQRAFQQGQQLIVEQHASWRSAETGEVIGESEIASRFVVEQGQVSQFARYDNLEIALAENGLTLADEVSRADLEK